MDRLEELKKIYNDSRLFSLFDLKAEEENENFSSLRLKPNKFRIRAFELWNEKDDSFVRIYHGSSIPESIKTELNSVNKNIKSVKNISDFNGDFLSIFTKFYEILSSDKSNEVAEKTQLFTRNSAYEGLALPDVDTSDSNILGVEFSWKEIIAISEDDSDENNLKKVLSQSGVYLQRSKNGASRYVGSAYGAGGILSRWIKHLNSNGDAKHLNLYVLENGYNNLVFTILEIVDDNLVLDSEKRWKKTLGTKNSGPYDGCRLNKN